LIRRPVSTSQQERAHRLRVAAAFDLAPLPIDHDGLGLIAGQREDVQVADDPGKRLGIDVVGRAGAAVLVEDELACPP
jgi:hypothetical protein